MDVAISTRDLQKERYWSAIIERQRESGKSQAEFCRDEGLSAHNFYYWINVLAKRQKEKHQAKPKENHATIPFVPLKVPDSLDFSIKPDAAEPIEFSKIVVRISASTDKSTLACLLQFLEKA